MPAIRTISFLVAIVIHVVITVNCESLTLTWYKKDVSTTDPTVATAQGLVRGSVMRSEKNRTFYAFRGIPYAEPPIENHRFAAPVTKAAWTGILDATEDVQPCAQYHFFQMSGLEDCLYLSVFVPQLPDNKRTNPLPVVFHIHGGAYTWGSNNASEFDPKLLMDHDVILVMPNYRLGVFGFLSTGDKAASGNWGLKDQLLALQWTNDNIHCFGGDPKKITLMGDSVGAASAHLLTLTDQAKGLVHRLVTFGGNALTPWAQKRAASYANVAFKFGEKVSCGTHHSRALLDCLRKLSTTEVLTGAIAMFDWLELQSPAIVWGPCVEPAVEGALLTDTVENLISAGKQTDIPWINVGAPREGVIMSGSFYRNISLFDEFLDHFDERGPYVLLFNDSNYDEATIMAGIKSYYLHDLQPNTDKKLLLENFTDAVTDGFWSYPSKVALDNHFSRLSSPVYSLSLGYRGTFSKSFLWTGGVTENVGSVHGDDLLYVFPRYELYLPQLKLKRSDNDMRIHDIMLQLLISFVVDGVPSTEGLGITWDPYSFTGTQLRVGDGPSTDLTIECPYANEEIRFWGELYERAQLPNNPLLGFIGDNVTTTLDV